MKGLVKRLLRENLLFENNFGYRAGDLNRKPEHKSNFSSGSRGTGHFGTGYYFVGSKEKAEKYGESENRVISIVDFSKYNLAKGTLKLHELLKNVNDHALGAHKDDNKLKSSIKNVFDYFNFELEPLEKYPEEKIMVRNNRDYEALTPEQQKQFYIDLDIISQINRNNSAIADRNDEKIKGIIDMIHNDNDDSPSTVLMKYLGFEGVDVRGTDLDNGVYGSVIYDIKKDSIIQ